jgi:anti-sigma regulatory factor (Ser/Thr protein kinase)
MEHRLEIPIPCALSALTETAEAAADFAVTHGLSQRITFALELAIDEIASNIIHHGFNEIADGAQIILGLDVDPDRMTATFFDNAPAFDPLVEAPQPDTTSDIETRAVGGLGVHLVKSLTDGASYERKENQNRLTLTWNRATENDA